MTYRMKLASEPFKQIESEMKTIEMRLDYTERKNIKIGDEIIFELALDPSKTLRTRVKDIFRFNNFDELYETLDLTKCGYTKENVSHASPKDMLKYYPKVKQSFYGVVAFEIELIKNA